MSVELPAWAMHRADAYDYAAVAAHHSKGSVRVHWPDLKHLRGWAKQQRWPVPMFGFQHSFLSTLLKSEANFMLAVRYSGISLNVPASTCVMPESELRELDELYHEPVAEQRAGSWRALVIGLREVRHAIEAGVVLTIEGGPTLRSWQAFYSWAHQRYPRLEEGTDSWIGSD